MKYDYGDRWYDVFGCFYYKTQYSMVIGGKGDKKEIRLRVVGVSEEKLGTGVWALALGAYFWQFSFF